MGLNKGLILFLALLFAGCVAAATFPYRYYGMDLPSYDGTLLGPEPKFDKPMAECSPVPGDKGRCTTMFTADFLSMKKEFLRMQIDLQKCQQGQ